MTRFSKFSAVLFVAVAALVGGHLDPALAQGKKGPAEVPVEELMKKTDLADLALGPADAKVTVVEYGSMTCGHCAHFATKVFPDIKKKYIDTNKVRFVFREFPLDNLAAAASMLARCAGDDKAFPLIETLYDKESKSLAVKWDDELVKATALTKDGAVIHPNFQPKA